MLTWVDILFAHQFVKDRERERKKKGSFQFEAENFDRGLHGGRRLVVGGTMEHFCDLPGWRDHHEVPLVLRGADSNRDYSAGAGGSAAAGQTGGEQKVFGNCLDCSVYLRHFAAGNVDWRLRKAGDELQCPELPLRLRYQRGGYHRAGYQRLHQKQPAIRREGMR